MSGRILIVDDDPHIRDILRYALNRNGFSTLDAADGNSAVELFQHEKPDLIVLDINLPERDGLEVCREVRKTSETPILFLTSRDDEIDRVLGLELGGDDYVAKPFSPRELVARVRTILKRIRPANATPPGAMCHGDVSLDHDRHAVSYAAKTIQLTATEFAILGELMKRPEHVRDRAALIGAAHDLNIHVSDRTVDSHIRNIRTKFETAGCTTIIETVHGVGYRLGACR